MWKIYHGNAKEKLKEIEPKTVQCVVTSPPYWGLRDYGEKDQLGMEPTPEEYVAKLVEIFREVKRGLRDDGTVWLNLGDSYAQSGGSGTGEYQKRHKQFGKVIDSGTKQDSRNAPKGYKPKDIVGIPWMVAFALRADGWYLRQEIVWAKTNPMPESVTDRCSKSHEYIFLLTKKAKYYFDHEAIKEPQAGSSLERAFCKNNVEQRKDANNPNYAISGRSQDAAHAKVRKKVEAGEEVTRNKRSVWYCEEDEFLQFLKWKAEHPLNKLDVWTVATQSYHGAHFATFSPKLIEPCILAGSKPGDVILDPFAGSGTTSYVAEDNGRDSIAIELSKKYCLMIEKRLKRMYPRLLHDRGVIS